MTEQALRSCELGMTDHEVKLLIDNPDRMELFRRWMFGQTLGFCDEHGTVYYRHDVERFLRGLPVID